MHLFEIAFMIDFSDLTRWAMNATSQIILICIRYPLTTFFIDGYVMLKYLLKSVTLNANPPPIIIMIPKFHRFANRDKNNKCCFLNKVGAHVGHLFEGGRLER